MLPLHQRPMYLASEEGFEPSRTEAPTGLANPPLQPLGYPDLYVRWWSLSCYRLSCPATRQTTLYTGRGGKSRTFVIRVSDEHTIPLYYASIYEKPLTLIIQWTFALLTYYLHICSVIEEIRLSFGELPLTSYPSLATNSHRGLITSNFHPSFSINFYC